MSRSVSQRGRSRRQIVRAYHARGDAGQEALLAEALCLSSQGTERAPELLTLLQRYGNQNFTFGATSFGELRRIFRLIRPRKDQIFCDVGAGYGHVVLYGAHVLPCRFRAIEILPVRCAAMKRSLRRSGLRRVEVVQRNAFDCDYRDVAYLFLSNPFFFDAAARFLDTVVAARRRALTVVATHNIVAVLRADRRFVEVAVNSGLPAYRFGIFRLRRRSPRRATRHEGRGD